MTIMRGGPGSGKSWYVAQRCFTTGVIPTVCSADDFFINDVGEYAFDPQWLGRAHGACLKKCVESMVTRLDIIVDNTNSKPQEMIPYLALAQAFSYSCAVVRVLCDPEIAWKRQTHGVPRDKFDAIHATVRQQQVPSMYRGAPWLTIKDEGESPARRRGPTIYQPYSGARCVKCGELIVYRDGFRFCDHEEDSCLCRDGDEEPSEPFAGQPRVCNCGVSMGLRSDHEGQCIATYLHKRR